MKQIFSLLTGGGSPYFIEEREILQALIAKHPGANSRISKVQISTAEDLNLKLPSGDPVYENVVNGVVGTTGVCVLLPEDLLLVPSLPADGKTIVFVINSHLGMVPVIEPGAEGFMVFKNASEYHIPKDARYCIGYLN